MALAAACSIGEASLSNGHSVYGCSLGLGAFLNFFGARGGLLLACVTCVSHALQRPLAGGILMAYNDKK